MATDSGNSSASEMQADASAEGGDEARRAAMMRQELESVDFYLAQGYSDIAGDTLEMLERQFGSHPEIQSRREVLKSSNSNNAKAQSDVFEFGGVEQIMAQNQPAATEVPGEPVRTFDVIPEVKPNVPPTFEVLPEVDPKTAASTSGNSAPAGGGLDAGLAEIFEEFRQAAEEEQPSSHEDYETHYNMGTAYKEMDLLDDAIHEFQTAAGLVNPNDGTSRYLHCCNLLGHCFVRKELPRAAAIWFQKALDAGGQTDDERKALRYELATVYELMGETDRALDLFTEVYGLDVGYREVGEKVRKLEKERSNKKFKKKK